MAIDNLRSNINILKQLAKETSSLYIEISELKKLGNEKEVNLRKQKLKANLEQIRIVNNSIPNILDSISPFTKINYQNERVEELVNLNYPKREAGETISVTVKKDDEGKFLEELRLSKKAIEKIRYGSIKEESSSEYLKARIYAKIANKFFLKISNKISDSARFARLRANLKKSEMSYLINTYLSIIFFSTSLAAVLSLVMFFFFSFFSISFSTPFISSAQYSLQRIFSLGIVCLAFPILVFLWTYYYPYVNSKSIENKINRELPFVVIHMSAISSSNIEPSQILKIIALNKEYPATAREFKKIINQINFYGYDLLTSLKNRARETPSRKLAEVLNGIAATIAGGTDISAFFEKRAETLLFEYKLAGERYTRNATSFMDLYIGIVIAAPMIFTLLLMIMIMTGVSIGGLGTTQITVLIITIIAFINIMALAFLEAYQPNY